MARFLVKHELTYVKTSGSGQEQSSKTWKFYFLAPPGQYVGFAAEAGVEEVASNKTDELGLPICTVEALLSSDVAVRKVLVYKDGTKMKKAAIIVASNKADSFTTTNITTKKYREKDITKVATPLDARFY